MLRLSQNYVHIYEANNKEYDKKDDHKIPNPTNYL